MSQEIVNALSEVDGFHKDCMLLFNDIVASIRQNTLTDTIKDLERFAFVLRASMPYHDSHEALFA